MLTKEMVVSPDSHIYVAAYNGIVYVHEVEGEYVIIGRPCDYYGDAMTNIFRTRVRRGILERMGYPVILGENVEEDTDFFTKEKHLRVMPVLQVSKFDKFDGRDHWRIRHDRENRVGLYYDSEELEELYVEEYNEANTLDALEY